MLLSMTSRGVALAARRTSENAVKAKSNESNVWEGVRDLLERIDERIDAAFPAEISVTPADRMALDIYTRCVSLFAA